MNFHVTHNIYKRTAIIKFWKHIYLPMECNVKVKKDRYPIRLETVRAPKSVLYQTTSYDLELLNGYYVIFPEGFAGGWLHDLKQLLGSDIAGEFRLAFYDPVEEFNRL